LPTAQAGRFGPGGNLVTSCGSGRSSVSPKCRTAHSNATWSTLHSSKPASESSYSTLGGVVGWTVRTIMTYLSNLLSSLVRIRCEIPGKRRWSAAKRCVPFSNVRITPDVHFPARSEVAAAASVRTLSFTCWALLCPPIPVALPRQTTRHSPPNRNHANGGKRDKASCIFGSA
jgi:hypothetical protein